MFNFLVLQAAMAIGSVIGVIAYRVSMLAALQLIPDVVGGSNSSEITTLTVDLVYQNASLVTTVTAALINLLIIIILNIVSVHCSCLLDCACIVACLMVL